MNMKTLKKYDAFVNEFKLPGDFEGHPDDAPTMGKSIRKGAQKVKDFFSGAVSREEAIDIINSHSMKRRLYTNYQKTQPEIAEKLVEFIMENPEAQYFTWDAGANKFSQTGYSSMRESLKEIILENKKAEGRNIKRREKIRFFMKTTFNDFLNEEINSNIIPDLVKQGKTSQEIHDLASESEIEEWTEMMFRKEDRRADRNRTLSSLLAKTGYINLSKEGENEVKIYYELKGKSAYQKPFKQANFIYNIPLQKWLDGVKKYIDEKRYLPKEVIEEYTTLKNE